MVESHKTENDRMLEVKQMLGMVSERLETLTASIKEMRSDQKVAMERHNDIANQVAGEIVKREYIEGRLERLERARENFWPKVLIATSGVAALISAVTGTLVAVLQ